MFTKEELESWNELFPNCKIHESDLSNPTEAFLTNTLMSYLQMFGYRVEQPLNGVDGSREKRLFLIKLTSHIDHILKITDKSYSFTYHDLLWPTPKKTSHLLGILLNYLYYYNMYKTDVFAMANERMKTHQELLAQIERTEMDNERRKTKASKIKEDIATLAEQVPKAKAELDTLQSQKAEQKEKLVSLEKSVNNQAIKLSELKAQKNKLQKRVVFESEGRELVMQLSKLQCNIKDSEQLNRSLENKLQEHSINITNGQTLIKEIEKAKVLMPLELLESCKETSKRLEDTKLKSLEIVSKKQNMLELVEKYKSDVEFLKKKLQQSKIQFEEANTNKLHLIENMEKVCHTNNTKLENLNKEEHSLECALQEQSDVRTYLEEKISELMAPYRSETI